MVFLLIALCLSCALGCGHESAELADTPVRFDPGDIYVGDVPAFEEIPFEANLVNSADYPVNIKSIEVTCACTDARASAAVIPPGENVSISGRVRTGEKSQSFQHSLAVHIDDPRQPVAIVSIRGTTRRLITASSSAPLRLSPDFVNRTADSEIIVFTNNSPTAVKLQQPLSLPSGLSLKLPNMPLQPGASADVQIMASPVFPSSVTLKVRIPCSHPREKDIPVDVLIRPKSAIEVYPKSIRFGVSHKRDILSRKSVTLVMQGDSVTSLEPRKATLPEYLELNEDRIINPTTRQLSFTILDRFTERVLMSTIEIPVTAASSGGRAVIPIPVSGTLLD